jgi:CubicO group peptidase (beta-lactamase class C family)
MTLFIRGLLIVVGGAFALAVANLFISGVPETEGTAIDIAALSADGETATDADQPGLGQMLMDLARGTVLPDDPPPTQILDAPDAPDAPEEITTDVDAISRIWRDWMATNEIETGALAVILPNGREYGTSLGRTPDDLHPVMSLTKAITGLCVDQLLLENDLGWDTTLADIAPQMSAAGLTPRAWNDHITLAAFANHTSGLAPDLTQSNMAGDTHGALGLHRRWAADALQEDAITGEPGVHFYSNTNYAVLGVVVEALSGQSYAQACTDRILTPAGITETVIEGRYGSLSSYGGWEISAMDYARLAQHWFAPDQPHMTDPRPDFDGYALGYFDDGETIQHAGRFCQRDHPTGGVGSLFIHSRDGLVLSMNWDACAMPARRDLLIEQLIEAL